MFVLCMIPMGCMLSVRAIPVGFMIVLNMLVVSVLVLLDSGLLRRRLTF